MLNIEFGIHLYRTMNQPIHQIGFEVGIRFLVGLDCCTIIFPSGSEIAGLIILQIPMKG